MIETGDRPSNATDLRNALTRELVIKKAEARREYKGHFGAAEYYRKSHKRLGSIAVILGIIAGSGFLAEATNLVSGLRFIPSLLTLVAACLTGLITYSKYSELSALHYQSGQKWEQLRDQYQSLFLKVSTATDDSELKAVFDEFEAISTARAKTRQASIPIPGWLFRRHERILDKTDEPLSGEE